MFSLVSGLGLENYCFSYGSALEAKATENGWRGGGGGGGLHVALALKCRLSSNFYR